MSVKRDRADHTLVLMTAQQLASSLVRTICLAHGVSAADQQRWRIHENTIHFHDKSTTEIAWNDVMAIEMYNEFSGDTLPVPLMATESSNTHHHTSEFDGGYVPGMGPHDHRDNFNGGFCFSVWHPGTDLPQMPWNI